MIKSLVLTPLLLACAFGQGTTGTATFTRVYTFPPVGLATMETAQVNVLNIAQSSTAANAVAPSCTGTINFANASGTSVAKQSFTTSGSQVSSAQLSFSTLASSGTRAEFVASVEVSSSVPSTAPCSLVFSLETYDTSGVTHVYIGNSVASAVPINVVTPVFMH